MGTLRLREGVLAQTDLRHAVLLDSHSGEYFELNAVGTEIVRALLAGRGEQGAVDALCARFEIGPERARADAVDFIGSLVERGLLVRGE